MIGRATHHSTQIAIAVRADAPASSGGVMNASGRALRAIRMRFTARTCPTAV
jgi:hypothetical protein